MMSLTNFLKVIVNTDWISQINLVFIQGMCNAMGMSFYKYGDIKIGYPDKVDAIASLEKRLEKYKQTGNKEWLIDVANFAMIEFTYPKHPDAHYAPKDSNESPGRKFHGEIDSSKRGNKDI